MSASVPDEPADHRSQLNLLVLGAFALGQSIQVNNGVIHPLALAWLSVGLIVMTTAMLPAVVRRLWMLARLPTTGLLIACVGVQWIEVLVWDWRWGTRDWPMIGCLLVAASGVAVAIGIRPARIWPARIRPARVCVATTLLVAGHFAAGALTIRSLPAPAIDVWIFQQESTAALLAGRDPYGVRFPDIYRHEPSNYGAGVSVDGQLTYSYPYPPAMLILTAPARLLCGDVRWAHLLALELSAALIALTGRGRVAILAAALLLLSPRALLVIKVGWTEPMVILALTAVVSCAARWPRGLWAAFGLLLSVKQYTLLAAPLVALLVCRRGATRLVVKSALLAAAVTAPFLLWNPLGFVRSAILWQFAQPFRPDSLSYAALIRWTTGIEPRAWLGFVGAGAAIVLCLGKAPRHAGGFSISLALVLLVFFALNKQAFCNYYFLVVGAGCAGVAAASGPVRATQRDDEFVGASHRASRDVSTARVGNRGLPAVSAPTAPLRFRRAG